MTQEAERRFAGEKLEIIDEEERKHILACWLGNYIITVSRSLYDLLSEVPAHD